jgi:hypothetical protein
VLRVRPILSALLAATPRLCVTSPTFFRLKTCERRLFWLCPYVHHQMPYAPWSERHRPYGQKTFSWHRIYGRLRIRVKILP